MILTILLTHGVCSVACASVSIAFFLVQFWPPPPDPCLSSCAGGRLISVGLSQHILRDNDLATCIGQVGLVQVGL